MTQPTFTEGPPVPLMIEGVLDAVKLAELFSDLTTHASAIEVRKKGGPAAYSGTVESTLDGLLAELQKGAERAAQIRYHFDGHNWTDTLFATSKGFRIIRTRHE